MARGGDFKPPGARQGPRPIATCACVAPPGLGIQLDVALAAWAEVAEPSGADEVLVVRRPERADAPWARHACVLLCVHVSC
jgi:hypothetical protein